MTNIRQASTYESEVRAGDLVMPIQPIFTGDKKRPCLVLMFDEKTNYALIAPLQSNSIYNEIENGARFMPHYFKRIQIQSRSSGVDGKETANNGYPILYTKNELANTVSYLNIAQITTVPYSSLLKLTIPNHVEKASMSRLWDILEIELFPSLYTKRPETQPVSRSPFKSEIYESCDKEREFLYYYPQSVESAQSYPMLLISGAKLQDKHVLPISSKIYDAKDPNFAYQLLVNNTLDPEKIIDKHPNGIKAIQLSNVLSLAPVHFCVDVNKITFLKESEYCAFIPEPENCYLGRKDNMRLNKLMQKYYIDGPRAEMKAAVFTKKNLSSFSKVTQKLSTFALSKPISSVPAPTETKPLKTSSSSTSLRKEAKEWYPDEKSKIASVEISMPPAETLLQVIREESKPVLSLGSSKKDEQSIALRGSSPAFSLGSNKKSGPGMSFR